MQVSTIPPPAPLPASSTSEPMAEVARALAPRKDAALIDEMLAVTFDAMA